MKAARRILSIWLPYLAIERWAKTKGCEHRSADRPPDGPFAPLDAPVVLTTEGTHGPIIHAVTRTAAERGARPGARLTDARALDPALVALPADPAGDQALVERLASWAMRWSPLVEVDGADALRLDISGVAHLFGGETELVGDVRARFAAMGLTVRTATAPTAGAAWALARYGPSSSIVTPAKAGVQANGSTSGQHRRDSSFRWNDEKGNLAALLAPLPVAALRLPPHSVRTLERLGLKTVGQLAGIERRSLARRFREQDNPVDALDRALGRKPEPLTAAACELPPRATLRLEEPATHPEAPAQALDRLMPGLIRQLEQRRLGARRLALTGFRVDGSIAVVSVATSIASREPRHLKRLLAAKAAALDPGFGFDAFALEASWAEPLGAAQQSLVEEPDGEADVARLVDRLSVRLGADAVRRPVQHESHIPERASGWTSAVASLRGAKATKQSSGANLDCFPRLEAGVAMTKRPQRLLDRPEAIDVIYATPEGMPRRFVWRRGVHDIARVEGPERIAPEWWRERSTARLRDYYRVEDQAGRRYWIYREGLIGDGRGDLPGWFMHGLFG